MFQLLRGTYYVLHAVFDVTKSGRERWRKRNTVRHRFCFYKIFVRFL